MLELKIELHSVMRSHPKSAFSELIALQRCAHILINSNLWNRMKTIKQHILYGSVARVNVFFLLLHTFIMAHATITHILIISLHIFFSFIFSLNAMELENMLRLITFKKIFNKVQSIKWSPYIIAFWNSSNALSLHRWKQISAYDIINNDCLIAGNAQNEYDA